jgi:hypothetical protein
MRRAGERSSEPTGPASQRLLFTDATRPSTTFTCTDSYCAQPTPYHEPCAAPPRAPRGKAARIPREWSPVGRASVRHPAIGRCTSRLLIGSASWPVAAAVAYKVLWIAVSATSAPQRRQHPSWCPTTLVSASLSALVAISRSHLLVWWWLAHGEVEGQLVGAAIGQVHPLAAVWAHQVGGPRTAAKGLDDLLLLGRHLFTLPQLCSISTRCAGWPSTISQTTWGAMPLGMSAGRSPRRSHRILVLQPRSCVGCSIGFDLNEWVRTAILAIKVGP